jgi:hypothetical protein
MPTADRAAIHAQRKTWPLPFAPTDDAATCPLTAWECASYCEFCFLGLCEWCPERGCECWHDYHDGDLQGIE